MSGVRIPLGVLLSVASPEGLGANYLRASLAGNCAANPSVRITCELRSQVIARRIPVPATRLVLGELRQVVRAGACVYSIGWVCCVAVVSTRDQLSVADDAEAQATPFLRDARASMIW